MSALTGTALGRAALVLTVADVLHAVDHTRQGRHLASEVYVAGVAGWIALAVLLVLIARRHPLAAMYAAAVGASVAFGFVLVHVAPHWSALSDPYSGFDADALSWALVVVPVAAAVNLVVQAARAHARTRRSPPAPDRAAGASSAPA
jgi:hypothetical protein